VADEIDPGAVAIAALAPTIFVGRGASGV